MPLLLGGSPVDLFRAGAVRGQPVAAGPEVGPGVGRRDRAGEGAAVDGVPQDVVALERACAGAVVGAAGRLMEAAVQSPLAFSSARHLHSGLLPLSRPQP